MYELPSDPISKARYAVAHFQTSIRIYRPKLQLEVESCFRYKSDSTELERRMLDEPDAVRAEFKYLVEASYEVDVYDRASFISASTSFLIMDEIFSDLARGFGVQGGLRADFGKVQLTTTQTVSLPAIATACGNMLRHILEWEELDFDIPTRSYVVPDDNGAKRIFERQMASIDVIRQSVKTEFPVARHDAVMLLDMLSSNWDTHERSYAILESRLFQCRDELALRAGLTIDEL